MQLSTDLFWWDGKAKEFRQEASTLNLPPNSTFQLGITLKNPKTNNTEHFMYMKTIRDEQENEVVGWKFENEKGNCFITVWND